MVLEFHRKSDKILDKMYYSILKCGYVANKFTLNYNLYYIIGTIGEIILMIYMICTNYSDYNDATIRTNSNIFKTVDNSTYEYSNFDDEMSFFINFFNIYYHLGLTSFYVLLSILVLIFFSRIFQFIYFMSDSANIINPERKELIFFYYISILDLFMRTVGEFMMLLISLIVFSCSKVEVTNPIDSTSTITTNMNSQLNIECFKGDHILLVVMSGIILLAILVNFTYSLYFYDPNDVITKKNYGVSDNFNRNLLWFIIKINLIVMNLFEPIKSQGELVKLCIFIGINLINQFYTYKTLVKSNCFVQDVRIIKENFLLVISILVLCYSITNTKITIMIFILMILIALMIGYFVKRVFYTYKFSELYARVSIIY